MDEGIHALAQRKLKLDAAVLQGVTATGDAQQRKKSGAAAETVQARTASHLPWHCRPTV